MWQWLLFELPVLFGFTLMFGSVLSGGDGDSDDGGGDDGGDGDLEDASNAEVNPGITGRIFGFLGFGKAPLILVLATMGLTFGGFGGLLTKNLGTAWALPNAGIAFVVMFFSTGFVARTVTRLMPKTESYDVSSKSFGGKVGVLTLPTNHTYGEARVQDEHGHTHLCKCLTSEGELPRGAQVLLIEYDDTINGYYVEQYQT